MQIKRFVEAQAPNIQVTGAEYPPTYEKELAAKAVQMGLVVILALAFAGDKICAALGQPVPEAI